MGTEFGIANYVDVVPAYLAKANDDSHGASQREFLYPLAMQVPGVLHIVDGKAAGWPLIDRTPTLFDQFLFKRVCSRGKFWK